jgi:methylated-DNA-[protein]-cysteine S-methyltransferase
MKRYDYYDSPCGRLLLVADGEALCAVQFVGQKHMREVEADWVRDARSPVIVRTKRELDEYFRGKRRSFDIALAASGTPFQRAVWQAIAGHRIVGADGSLAGYAGGTDKKRALLALESGAGSGLFQARAAG